jgi:hypothetical protein
LNGCHEGVEVRDRPTNLRTVAHKPMSSVISDSMEIPPGTLILPFSMRKTSRTDKAWRGKAIRKSSAWKGWIAALRPASNPSCANTN